MDNLHLTFLVVKLLTLINNLIYSKYGHDLNETIGITNQISAKKFKINEYHYYFVFSY